MSLMAIVAATAEPTQQSGYPDPESVTPGTIGFVATFLLAAAVVLLARSLLKRQRRIRARSGEVRYHPIPVERGPRRGPQNVGMSTGVDLETGESLPADPGEGAPGSSASPR